MSAWAEIVGRDDSEEWTQLCARALAEIQTGARRVVALHIRNNKVRNPLGETEEHLNWVLDELAGEVERGVLNSGG